MADSENAQTPSQVDGSPNPGTPHAVVRKSARNSVPPHKFDCQEQEDIQKIESHLLKYTLNETKALKNKQVASDRDKIAIDEICTGKQRQVVVTLSSATFGYVSDVFHGYYDNLVKKGEATVTCQEQTGQKDSIVSKVYKVKKSGAKKHTTFNFFLTTSKVLINGNMHLIREELEALQHSIGENADALDELDRQVKSAISAYLESHEVLDVQTDSGEEDMSLAGRAYEQTASNKKTATGSEPEGPLISVDSRDKHPELTRSIEPKLGTKATEQIQDQVVNTSDGDTTCSPQSKSSTPAVIMQPVSPLDPPHQGQTTCACANDRLTKIETSICELIVQMKHIFEIANHESKPQSCNCKTVDSDSTNTAKAREKKLDQLTDSMNRKFSELNKKMPSYADVINRSEQSTVASSQACSPNTRLVSGPIGSPGPHGSTLNELGLAQWAGYQPTTTPDRERRNMTRRKLTLDTSYNRRGNQKPRQRRSPRRYRNTQTR